MFNVSMKKEMINIYHLCEVHAAENIPINTAIIHKYIQMVYFLQDRLAYIY